MIFQVHVARMFYIENEVRISSAIVKYRKFTDIFIKAKLWDFRPLVVKVMAKSDISVDYGPSVTAQLVATS